jgi:hypothetical protein
MRPVACAATRFGRIEQAFESEGLFAAGKEGTLHQIVKKTQMMTRERGRF